LIICAFLIQRGLPHCLNVLKTVGQAPLDFKKQIVLYRILGIKEPYN
jgi:hypothetical protein